MLKLGEEIQNLVKFVSSPTPHPTVSGFKKSCTTEYKQQHNEGWRYGDKMMG